MGEGNYEPAYVEDFHGVLMEKFHEFRASKNSDNDVTEVLMTGMDMNKIIAKAKMELYRRRPDAENAGFKKH